MNAHIDDGRHFEQHVIDRHFQFALVHARSHRGIALRVQIDHQHALANLGQAGGQIDGGGGFADAAFLVGNAEYFGHSVILVVFRERKRDA